MNWIGVLLLTFYTFTTSCNSSSSSSGVSFVNTSSIVRVSLGEEAVIECATEHLANNHLVRERKSGLGENEADFQICSLKLLCKSCGGCWQIVEKLKAGQEMEETHLNIFFISIQNIQKPVSVDHVKSGTLFEIQFKSVLQTCHLFDYFQL